MRPPGCDLASVVEDVERVRAGLVRRCVFEKRYLRKDGGFTLGRVGVSPGRFVRGLLDARAA